LNISNILNIKSSLVDEAIIDMIKNVFVLSPKNSIILEMCIKIIDSKL